MPPSANNLFPTVMMGGKPRRVPSKELTVFKKAMGQWHLAHDMLVKQARMFCLEVLARKNFLRADTYFCVPAPSIYYLNGNIRKSDVSNRVKSLHDEFCTIIGVDDSRIKAGYFEQMGIEGETPFSFVVLSEHRFRMINNYSFGEVVR